MTLKPLFGLVALVVAVILPVSGVVAGPLACQLEGEYRGSVATRSHVSTRQGLFRMTFHPPAACEDGTPGTVHLLMRSREFDGSEWIVWDITGPYTVSGDGYLRAQLAPVTIEGLATGYACGVAHALVVQAGEETSINITAVMLRLSGACGASL